MKIIERPLDYKSRCLQSIRIIRNCTTTYDVPKYVKPHSYFEENLLLLEDLLNKFIITEKALDIAIKDLCFSVKGSDACNPLDALYEGIRDRIMEQARKEVQE